MFDLGYHNSNLFHAFVTLIYKIILGAIIRNEKYRDTDEALQMEFQHQTVKASGEQVYYVCEILLEILILRD